MDIDAKKRGNGPKKRVKRKKKAELRHTMKEANVGKEEEERTGTNAFRNREETMGQLEANEEKRR
jgi:hypothetical protein